MVPMHAKKRKGALHEPTQPRPLPGGEQAFERVLSVPLLGGVRGGFMVPMHVIKVVRLSWNAGRSNSSHDCESGRSQNSTRQGPEKQKNQIGRASCRERV